MFIRSHATNSELAPFWVCTWGDPKKTGFSLKKRFIYISYKKHLISFKILSIGGNTLVQSLFPLCEASLELLQLLLLSASCEAVFTSSTVANLCPFNVFLTVRNKKKSQGARSGE